MGDSFWNILLQAPDRALGLNVREELLARLTDEFALAILPGADDARSLPALFGRFVLVAGVTDVPGLRASLDRAFRERGLHAGRKVRKVEGGEVSVVELAGVRFGIAFGRRLVGVGGGDAVDYLEQVLALEAGRGGAKPADLPGGAGGGNAIALASWDLAAALELLQQAERLWRQAFAAFGTGTGGAREVAGSLAARLRELGIARLSGRAEQTPSGIRGTIDW